MIPPTDMVNAGNDRNFADRMLYLRWETALGNKYATLDLYPHPPAISQEEGRGRGEGQVGV